MEWYKLNEQQRIKEYYSKFSIESFWDWWSDGERRVMEVRILDWVLIKQVAEKYQLPYSPSGVYVWSASQLKNVIAMVRDKATVWFGVQPRKKNWNSKGWKSFGGLDANVSEIAFLFIDIDRVVTGKVATNRDLENCDRLLNKILERFEKHNWAKSYIKICSGHGLQALVKLEYAVKMPEIEYENKSKSYITNDEFEKVKNIFRQGIGKQIKALADKFKDELGVALDRSCFTIGRVAALPVTKNIKYGTQVWRGILEMKDEDNLGLSDYIMSAITDVKEFKSQNIFTKSRANYRQDMVKSVVELRRHPVVQFLLNNKELPGGERNNIIWMSVKILIRDNKLDMNTTQFRVLHKEIEAAYHGTLTLNLPDKKYTFNKNTLNNFCIRNCLPLIYPLWENKTKKLDMKLESISWGNKDLVDYKKVLRSTTSITEDMAEVKNTLIEGDYCNKDRIGCFINSCLDKYGSQKTQYYFDTLFYKFFSYD